MRTILLLCLSVFVLTTGIPNAVHAQSTEEQITNLLALLDRGESVENRTVNLRDIQFKFDSAELDEASTAYLDWVVLFLQRVDNINLNIAGHTDNVGDAQVNMQRSTERAETVRTYLVSGGIDPARLVAEGYGSTHPLSSNETREGRAKNRRVELQLIKKETVERVQDLLYLRNGEVLGVVIIAVGNGSITYRSFEDGQVYEIPTSEVEKAVYASGEEISFEDVPLDETDEPAFEAASRVRREPLQNTGTKVGVALTYGLDIERPGVQASVYQPILDEDVYEGLGPIQLIEVGGDFTFYFPRKLEGLFTNTEFTVNYFELNLNGRVFFHNEPSLRAYGLLGSHFALVSVSGEDTILLFGNSTEAGLNLGVGGEFGLAAGKGFAELRYPIGGFSQLTLGAGFRLTFGGR